MSPKRPSGTSELPRPTFFIDENISHGLVAALRAAGAKAEHFFDHFDRGTIDADWLPEIGDRGWFVLTRDARQRTRKAEIEAIKRAKVGQSYCGASR